MWEIPQWSLTISTGWLRPGVSKVSVGAVAACEASGRDARPRNRELKNTPLRKNLSPGMPLTDYAECIPGRKSLRESWVGTADPSTPLRFGRDDKLSVVS